MGGSAKVAVDVDAQITDRADRFNGSTSDRDGTSRKLRLSTSQCASHHLSLLSIYLEPITTHPGRYVVDSWRDVGRQTGNGSSRTGDINLTVICIKVQRQTVIGDDSCQVNCVDDEEDRSEDQTLWYATDDIRNTELLPPQRTCCFRPARYDECHVRATSSTPKVTRSLLRRIS